MIHNSPENIQVIETDWWFLFDSESLTIVTEPQQCSGYCFSPYSMFVGDSLEECEEYMEDNGIIRDLFEEISTDFFEN